jgi:hypothetical protein
MTLVRGLQVFGRIAVLGALALAPRGAAADVPRAPDAPLDQVVARFWAAETGGASKPQVVFERELAFEARLEALADPDAEPGVPYLERHVRAALDRHLAETLLAALPIVPKPTPTEIASRAESARAILEQRVQGREKLIAAAAAEGQSSDELDALLRRQARASIYLDRMVAPMLEPSELELREVLRTGATPFGRQPYAAVAKPLARWWIGQRLAQALDAYFQTARARVTLVLVKPGPRPGN